MRYCRLTNFKTGKTITAKSVAAFCRKSGLDRIDSNSVVHLYPVLRGERFQYFGWCLANFYNKKIKLKDRYGNFYSGTIQEICSRFNFTESQAFKLVSGKKKVIKGVSLMDYFFNHKPQKEHSVVKYVIESPNHKYLIGKTLKSVSRQIGAKNLSYRSLIDLTNGYTNNTKGYSVERIELVKKFAI